MAGRQDFFCAFCKAPMTEANEVDEKGNQILQCFNVPEHTAVLTDTKICFDVVKP